MKNAKPATVPPEAHAAAVAKACALIEASVSAPDLTSLAKSVHMSVSNFHRVFRSLTGLTPKAYATALRSTRVRKALAAGASVTDALYAAGFGSSGRFYESASTLLGMKPSAFRSGGTGQAVKFAVGESSLGAVLVAATGAGVCAITLGDDPDALVRDLQDRFPNARLIGADPAFEQTVSYAVGFVERPGRDWSLPLDIRGTAFQQRVWQALRKIPLGTTATYADIARRIGKPRAVRAVAQACGANSIAVAIPCHRVVRTDGSLSGYRWGVDRKKALLTREHAL